MLCRVRAEHFLRWLPHEAAARGDPIYVHNLAANLQHSVNPREAKTNSSAWHGAMGLTTRLTVVMRKDWVFSQRFGVTRMKTFLGDHACLTRFDVRRTGPVKVDSMRTLHEETAGNK